MKPGISKVFLAGHDWPALADSHGGHLTQLIEQRLGYKQAASDLFSKKELDENKPPKGWFMRHQIVMGDQEKYGFNINADSFPGDTLDKYHHTFVSNGHVFREHHNQDPKFAIGRIKAAKYSRQTGRVETLEHLEIAKAEKEYEAAKQGKDLAASHACRVPFDVCLAPGTLITTRGGDVRIEDVKLGTVVLSHKGAWRKVTRLFHTPSRRGGVHFTVQSTVKELVCTDNHPLFVLKAGAGITENQRRFVRRQYNEAGEVVAVTGYDSPTFVAASDVSCSDYLLTPVQVSGRNQPTIDPWLAGLALADGSIFGRNRGRKRRGPWRAAGIQFSLGLDKQPIVDKLVATAKKSGLPCKVYKCKDKKAVAVVIHSVPLAEEWMRLFGRSSGKHVSHEVLSWTQTALLQLLAGWIDGDGSQDPHTGNVRAHSVLEAIAVGMRKVATSAGVFSSLSRHSLTKGPWSASGSTHVLLITRKNVNKIQPFSARLEPVSPEAKNNGQGFFLNFEGTLYLAHRVKTAERVELNETYNLAVSVDESYVANEFAVHNCNACGNKAKYAANYCAHLRDTPKRYLSKLQKYAFAINPIVRFFDSSVVANPAAREARHIAYRFADDTRTKAASEHGVLTGADRAEAERFELPDGWDLPHRDSQLLGKLASIESGTCEACMSKQAALRMLGSHNITDRDVDAVSKLLPRTLFSKLASAGAWLPLDVFSSYMTGNSLAEVRQADYYKQAKLHEPFMFSSLQRQLKQGSCAIDPDSLGMFEACEPSRESHDPACCDEIDQVLSSVGADCSMHPKNVRERVITITIKSAKIVLPPPAGVSPLAEIYALYKLASLRTIIDRGMPEHLALLACLQSCD